MSNFKCHKCGLVNFAGSTVCKRCKSSLTAGSDTSNQQTFTKSQSKPNTQSTNYISVQPSFISIVKNDYVALLGMIVPLVFWGMFIGVNIFGISISKRGGNAIASNSTDSTFLYIAIIGTIVGIVLLAWRVYSFQQIFANGDTAIGRITSVSFFKDRGRIEYFYNVDGETYQSGTAIMKNQKTQSFRDGDEIELVVERSNPKRAFIKTLYS